ncbi:glutathione S-transferase family protein [Pseudomonas sp. MYb185]|uniref:glutathione S-transferase family protein n=1 Tax=Pseudomonas sp. MYb185 TaxID=1848729 RepID=UPI000CFB4FE9|nr:glutathione S-transferase [Pseudomonas sp. MYb185]PRB77454.1 glutathione S-transferase [Pseudomonas sp. MYb185]
MSPVTPPVMLRLHGYAVSNYFNIAHAALLESGVRFEIVECRASQTPEFLRLSPMGKIPVLETPQGWIAETVAILGYIEDCFPCLLPTDPFTRARQRQLINVVQVYVELPMRSLYPGVFMGATNSSAAIETARQTLDRSTIALRSLAQPQPYLAGEQAGHADLFAFYCLDLAERVSREVYGRSLLHELGLSEWAQLMAQRNSSQIVLAAFAEAFGAYLMEKQATYPFRAGESIRG